MLNNAAQAIWEMTLQLVQLLTAKFFFCLLIFEGDAIGTRTEFPERNHNTYIHVLQVIVVIKARPILGLMRSQWSKPAPSLVACDHIDQTTKPTPFLVSCDRSDQSPPHAWLHAIAVIKAHRILGCMWGLWSQSWQWSKPASSLVSCDHWNQFSSYPIPGITCDWPQWAKGSLTVYLQSRPTT